MRECYTILLYNIYTSCSYSMINFTLPPRRDHYLHSWVSLLSQSPITAYLYEPVSFLRDPELLQNLLDALTLTADLSIRLERLFSQGL